MWRALGYLRRYRARDGRRARRAVCASRRRTSPRRRWSASPSIAAWRRATGARCSSPSSAWSAIAVGRGLFNFLQGYLAERASQGVAFDLREALFARIQRLSFSYYDQAQTGQLLTRLTNDVEQVRTFVGTGVIQLARVAGDAHRLRGRALHASTRRSPASRSLDHPADLLTCSRSSSAAHRAAVRARADGARQAQRRAAGGPAGPARGARVLRRRARGGALPARSTTSCAISTSTLIARHQQQLPVREPLRQPRHHRRRRLRRPAGVPPSPDARRAASRSTATSASCSCRS